MYVCVWERGRYPVNQAYVTPLCESGATYVQYIWYFFVRDSKQPLLTSHLLALPSHTSPLLGYTIIAFLVNWREFCHSITESIKSNSFCFGKSIGINCRNYLLKFVYKGFNKMGRCTVYSNCMHLVALIYYIQALLKTLSWWGILTIYRAKTDPRWNFDVLFFKQLNTGLQIVFQ